MAEPQIVSEDNRLKTAAMLSELWDGRPVKRVRALDGVTILPGRRLSLHVTIQPEAAAGFLCNETLRDQGLLSRVLVAAPASLASSRAYQEPCPQAAASEAMEGAVRLAEWYVCEALRLKQAGRTGLGCGLSSTGRCALALRCQSFPPPTS